jgi:hypothetical protein
VPRDSIFGRTTGAQNAALITGEHSGDTGIFGAGAGGDATAVAIIGDLAAIARDTAAIVPPPVLSAPRSILGPTTLNPARAKTDDLCVLGGVYIDRLVPAEVL